MGYRGDPGSDGRLGPPVSLTSDLSAGVLCCMYGSVGFSW